MDRLQDPDPDSDDRVIIPLRSGQIIKNRPVLFLFKSLRKQAGFTLLEILVALAIFALAASVLLVADGRAIKQTARVQEKIHASWLADQSLNRYYAESLFPDPGKRSSIAELAGRQWYLRDDIEETSQKSLRRIVVSVFSGSAKPRDNARPVFRLTGYIRRLKE